MSNDEKDAVGEELARERANVENARWTILHDGDILPVTNLYDGEGRATSNPNEAFSIVAFDKRLTEGKWLAISKIEPGDIWTRS